MNADQQIVVSCPNDWCPDPAPITTIELAVFARGIVSVPRLLCAGCGCELYEHHDPHPKS